MYTSKMKKERDHHFDFLRHLLEIQDLNSGVMAIFRHLLSTWH